MDVEENINYIKIFYNKLRSLSFNKKIKYFDQFHIYNHVNYNTFFEILTKNISEKNLLCNSESTLEEK